MNGKLLLNSIIVSFSNNANWHLNLTQLNIYTQLQCEGKGNEMRKVIMLVGNCLSIAYSITNFSFSHFAHRQSHL